MGMKSFMGLVATAEAGSLAVTWSDWRTCDCD